MDNVSDMVQAVEITAEVAQKVIDSEKQARARGCSDKINALLRDSKCALQFVERRVKGETVERFVNGESVEKVTAGNTVERMWIVVALGCLCLLMFLPIVAEASPTFYSPIAAPTSPPTGPADWCVSSVSGETDTCYWSLTTFISPLSAQTGVAPRQCGKRYRENWCE